MVSYPGEAIYLWLFDDVRNAVQQGAFASGQDHFDQNGQREIELGLRKPLPRKALSLKWLEGAGIEIGALHNPLSVYSERAQVTYVDRLDVPALRQHYPELANLPLVPVGIIDDGEKLETVESDSQDFVIANHVIEHTEDPIGALDSWFRVLRPGGVVYLGVPDKRYTFDRIRVNSPWLHFVADHEYGPEGTRRQHYEEWVRYVGQHTEPDVVDATVASLMEQNYSIHFHVWDADSFTDFLVRYRESYNPRFVMKEYEICPEHSEIIFVLEKTQALAA